MERLAHGLVDAGTLAPREVLSAAWTLFQVSLPKCLPLAIVAVAAGAVPGAEASAAGNPGGLPQTAQQWALYAASTALVLICYTAVLRLQLGLMQGDRTNLLVALQRAGRDLPVTIALFAMAVLPLAILQTLLFPRGLHGVMAVALLTTLAVALLLTLFAWPAVLSEAVGPGVAIARTLRRVRKHLPLLAAAGATSLAGILVFVLLAGIFMAIIMNLAGQGAQTSALGLALSRWLMAGVLAFPVVFASAALVIAYRVVVK
jgi:hypothetical protein